MERLNVVDKYWLILLLSSNVMTQYVPVSNIGNIVFLLSMAIGTIYCLLNTNVLLRKSVLHRFSFVFILAAIYVIYQFTFGWMHINERTWTYLLSKIVEDFAIVICVYKNRNTASTIIPFLFSIIVPILILVGFIQYDYILNGRSTMGFGNPNSLGSISAFTFGFCLLCGKIRSMSINYILASICLLGVLLSGSRSAMGIVIIAILFKYNVTLKNMAIVSLIVIGAIIIPPKLGYESVAISRLIETSQHENAFSAGREREREASILMIKENPIIGNGLYAQQSEEAKKISEMGSHNAYIDFVKMLGLPLGLVLIYYLIKTVVRLFLRYRNTSDEMKLHLFVLVAVLFAANFEAYLWGVNHYVTILFFISICFLQQEYYEWRYEGKTLIID